MDAYLEKMGVTSAARERLMEQAKEYGAGDDSNEGEALTALDGTPR